MAAAPKMIRKIRRELADELKRIWSDRSGSGEFSIKGIVTDIDKLLQSLDLNTYRMEIATALANIEDHTRSNAALPDQLDLFTEDDASQLVVPLNKGQRVFLADATMAHLDTKLANQIKQGTALQNSTQRFSNFMQTVRPVLQNKPRATVRDAMKNLGKW